MNSTFFDTLKWTLVTYKESYLKGFIGILIGFAIAAALPSSFFLNIVQSDGFYYKYAIASAWVFVWAISTMVIASTTFNNMQDKHNRTWFMMLPAKNSHKFWSRVLINFCLATLGNLIAMGCTDLFIMALQLLFHGRVESVSMALFDIVKGIREPMAYGIMGLMIMVSYTAYVLGSAVFRKWSWLFTTVSWNIIWTVLIFIAGLVAKAVDWEEFFIEIKDIQADALGYASMGILALIVAFNLWASYKVFARMQLITGKWLNI